MKGNFWGNMGEKMSKSALGLFPEIDYYYLEVFMSDPLFHSAAESRRYIFDMQYRTLCDDFMSSAVYTDRVRSLVGADDLLSAVHAFVDEFCAGKPNLQNAPYGTRLAFGTLLQDYLLTADEGYKALIDRLIPKPPPTARRRQSQKGCGLWPDGWC